MGNFKDSKLETLAKRGNGNYAYLDDLKEAEKVLVQEVTQTFYAVADDVYLNVHFNPSLVKNYRLVGFDNKRDQIGEGQGELEGGEIGSGNSLMALFEVEPTQADSLWLQQQAGQVLADVQVKYNIEGRADQQELLYNCMANYTPYVGLAGHYRFATAVAMFGLKLRESKFIRQPFQWEDIHREASASLNPNEYLQREFLPLINQAKKVYGGGKKKKKRNRQVE
jgi:Ca-activated chloride channel family protein